MSVSKNTKPSHTSPAAPPPAKDQRFGSGIDAGHRRRDAVKRGGSIGRGPARCFRRVVAESEDVVSVAVVLSPSRDLPSFAGAPLPPEIPVHRGSLPGRAAALDRKRERGHDQLFTDYFQPKALFTPAMFRPRFRMSRPLFRRIMDDVKLYDDYFCANVDAIGKASVRSVPDVNFEINGHHYTKGYYLADGIYPPWATLVKTIRKPNSEQEARFAKEQEAARKDVERVFGILQARWAIARYSARAWDVQTLWEVMTACVIMHNMIVEVERDDSLFDNDGRAGELVTPQGGPASFQDILHAHHEIRDLAVHNQLHADLIEHVWQHVGNNAANNNDERNPEA
ncbi:hypothetical protein QYE76_036616 [Lolium multiflorum]|uniref:Uncharacterized protein n=1 Tax=Lolium multiflorum TaxID=4521 RepID=A0AAD8R586_LOLMU|nr:hypothetical protein QYE76_036616 [Lolium multiflorum]